MKLLSRTELAFLGIAAVLHVGFLIVAQRFPSKNLLAQRELNAIDLIEVEVDRQAPQKEEDVEDLQPDQQRIAANAERRDQRRDAATRNSAGSNSANSAADPGEGGVDPGHEAGTQPAGPDEGFSAPESGDPPGLALGLGNDWIRNSEALKPGEKAPTQSPKEKKADRDAANKLVKDLLRQKDKKLGLDLPAAGTVASIIKAAVQGSDAPGEVRATFLVKLGPGGTVTSLTVQNSSGGSASMWNGIASSAKGAIAARKLNLTEDYKKGAIIVVNVQSKMTMPSGAEVGAGLKLSLTQNFDVADIGARPVRTITAPYSVTPVN